MSCRCLPASSLAHDRSHNSIYRIFHPTSPPDNDCPLSWSTEIAPYYSPECTGGPANESADGQLCPSSSARGPASGPYACLEQDPPPSSGGGIGGGAKGNFCAANVSAAEERFEFQLEDQRITSSSIAHLRLAAALPGRRPFFIGCGLHKPHNPWHFPAEFLRFFPPAERIPLAADPFAPQGMPPVAWHTPGNNLSPAFNLSFNGNATRSRIYRLGYYAAVAYTDYNIGRLLGALDGLGGAVARRTVTCVFGDHGWVRQRMLSPRLCLSR